MGRDSASKRPDEWNRLTALMESELQVLSENSQNFANTTQCSALTVWLLLCE